MASNVLQLHHDCVNRCEFNVHLVPELALNVKIVQCKFPIKYGRQVN